MSEESDVEEIEEESEEIEEKMSLDTRIDNAKKDFEN